MGVADLLAGLAMGDAEDAWMTALPRDGDEAAPVPESVTGGFRYGQQT